MRIISWLIVFTACVFSITLSAAPPPGYYLVWGDEFNQPSLDTNKWNYWLLGQWRDAVNTTNAVSFNGSNTVITTYTTNGTTYTAMLASEHHFCPRYGYWEGNIKWGDTNGMWSAIWLRSPTMGTYLDNTYVSGGEIDIAEHRYVGWYGTNIANIISCNIHWNGYGSQEQSSGSPNVGTGLAVGYHTYGLLWTSNSYIFSIDGAQVWDGSSVTPSFGSGAYLILSSEVDDTSTTWAGYIPTNGYPGQASSNVKYTIDYVRYYAPTNVLFWTGASSAYWTNSANWVSNMTPTSTSVLTFSSLSTNLNMTPGQNYSVAGLIFLNSSGAFSINGANTLTIGAGGVDIVPADHNVTLNAPIVIGANQTWLVGPNRPGNILTVNANLSGTATLTKAYPGTLILNGTNTFSGRLNVDTGSITNDGTLLIANPAAVSNLASVWIRNTSLGRSTLQLSNSTTISAMVNLAGRDTNVVAIESVSGSNQLSGGLTLNGGGSNYLVQADAGTLFSIGGTVSAGSSASGTRQLTFQGAGNFTVSASIQNGSATSLNVFKTNSGALAFNGSLAGSLTAGGGILAGTGTVSATSTIQSGCELSPGAAAANSIGTITFSNDLTLAPGSTTFMEINAGLNSNDQVNVGRTLTYGGTLCVTNLGGSFSLNQSFQLFKLRRVSGAFSALVLPTLDPSLAWNTDQLSSGILSVIANTNPPQFVVNLPPQVTVGSGKSYTYSVSVLSPQPYGYQWYNGATSINGATNSTYTLIAGAAGSTNYSVVATNNFGATTSIVSTFTSVAPPPGNYAPLVLGLNPVGYWPLQETNAPAPAAMETNYGTLGWLGNAWYAATNASVVNFAQTGALTGDSDPAVGVGVGQPSYAIVPRISPLLTIQAPFSTEAWVNPSNSTYGIIIGEGGGTGLNGNKVFGGFQMGVGSSQVQMQYYTGGNNTYKQITSAANYPAGAWYHVVTTYDGSNSITYVNGVPVDSGTSSNTPDLCSPLCIGNGKWDFGANGGVRQLAALVDEVAVYTNVLSASRIAAHYNAGVNPGVYGAYQTNIVADQPLLYYRMDCPGYTNTPAAQCPLAMNFGSAPENAAYLSGTLPGAVSGPTNSSLASGSVAVPMNGLTSCVDAGNDPLFNPTGTNAFTVAAWMRTYPSDGRLQSIISHGGSNWTMNLDGTSGKVVWAPANGSTVTSASILNDGNWHFLAGIYDGATNYLYVDGALSGLAAAPGSLTGETNVDVYLGGNADYTQVGNNQRYFAGTLAQVALFTNALTSSQIQSLFTGNGGANPAITASAPAVSISASAGNIVINYTGRLLSATTVNGPYTPVADAPFAYSSTNYIVSPMGAQLFYQAASQ